MRKKIKKLIALICIASILATSYPIFNGQTVKADALGISEFGRVFWSLGGSFGIKPNSNNTGSKFLGNLMDMYGRSFDVWMQVDKHRREDLQDVQSWQDLLNSNLQTFTKGMAKSFSHFMSDVQSGIYDEELGGNKSEVFNEKVSIEKALEGKKIVYDVSDTADNRYCVKLGDATSKPTLANIANFGIKPDTLINSVNSYFSSTGYNFERYLEASVYLYVDFIAIAQNADSFLFYNAENNTLTAYSENNHLYGYHYMNSSGYISAKTYLDRDLTIHKDYYRDGKLWVDTAGNPYSKGVMIYTNAYIRIYEDGSALIYDPARMSASTFDTIQDSLWDQISKSGTAIDDWAIADENGKTIDDPESKILEKIYKNMLTADDIKALQNGDTSVLDKIDGMTAVNEKTGETVGDIKDEVQDQTGILSGIKAIGRTIASRVLTIVNLIRNLHQRKWTAVIDNVGDIALPIVGSIESLQGIARAIQASKWVIDNVGDITNPLTTALDNVGDLVMDKIKTVSIAIDNVNANLSTVISGCQTKVINGIKSLSDTATSTLENIKSIPKSIATAVAGVFVPTSDDMDAIHTRMNTLCVEHFGVSGKELSISIPEKKFSSIYYKKKKIVDADVLNSGIDKIRPVVQGLMWFFMLLFAINQVLEIFDKKGVANGDDS